MVDAQLPKTSDSGSAPPRPPNITPDSQGHSRGHSPQTESSSEQEQPEHAQSSWPRQTLGQASRIPSHMRIPEYTGTSSSPEPGMSGSSPRSASVKGSPDTRRPLHPRSRSSSLGSSGPSQPGTFSSAPSIPLCQPSYRPTRSLFIQQSSVSAAQLRSDVTGFGDLQRLEQLDESGFCVTFFDIRAAQACCETLVQQHVARDSINALTPEVSSSLVAEANSTAWCWRPPPIFFVEPRNEDAARGSLLISGQESFLSAPEARRICSEHGPTGFVWGPIQQAHSATPAHLVGFHDTRAAQRAAERLQGARLSGNRLLVERVHDPIPSYTWPGAPGVPTFLPVPFVPGSSSAPSSPAREHLASKHTGDFRSGTRNFSQLGLSPSSSPPRHNPGHRKPLAARPSPLSMPPSIQPPGLYSAGDFLHKHSVFLLVKIPVPVN